MKNLKLSEAFLPGQPLSNEEMKSIIAGRSTTYSCSCHLNLTEGRTTGYEIDGVTSDKECRSQCKDACSKTPTCISYKIAFSVTDN